VIEEKVMNAIEFKAQVHDGIVEIPLEYRDWQNKTVRVILLEPVETEVFTKKSEFSAVALKTRNYRFNREEANER
jgi:hypothetical protein